jgi:hypothetical protein
MDEHDLTPEELSERERSQERASRKAAAEADSEEEARTELRRAEKAGYLRQRLDEQAEADRAKDGR